MDNFSLYTVFTISLVPVYFSMSNGLCGLCMPGTVPTTELLRHAGKLQQAYSLFCIDRILRPCVHSSKKVHEAAMQIAELATSDKYEGMFGLVYACRK